MSLYKSESLSSPQAIFIFHVPCQICSISVFILFDELKTLHEIKLLLEFELLTARLRSRFPMFARAQNGNMEIDFKEGSFLRQFLH